MVDVRLWKAWVEAIGKLQPPPWPADDPPPWLPPTDPDFTWDLDSAEAYLEWRAWNERHPDAWGKALDVSPPRPNREGADR